MSNLQSGVFVGTRALIAADFRTYDGGRTGLSGFLLALLLVPGFSLMLKHRLAARAYKSGKIGRLIGLLIWRCNIRASSCHISPLAQIGPGLNLPHSTGVVIGEGVRIGAHVTIYQNVTIGTRDKATYPEIDDDVVLFPGAVVVGGIRIGRGAIVGANAFVASNVPAGAIVGGIPARLISRSTSA